MKGGAIVWFSLCVATFVIGVHQLFFYSTHAGFSGGILRSYGLFMLSGVFFLAYRWRRARANRPPDAPPPKARNKRTTRRRK